MKYVASLFLFFIVVFASCRKKDKNYKGCNYALFALQSIGNDYSKMVSVDTATGKSVDNLPFPAIATYGGYLSQREKCYYVLQIDGKGRLNLIRMDLVAKSVNSYIGPYWGRDSIFYLTYSKSTEAFYFLSINDAVRPPVSGLYSIQLSNGSFSYQHLKPSNSPLLHLPPLVENDITGAIYFQWINGGYSMYAQFVPSQNEMIKTSIPTNLYEMKFNRNDGLIYGYFPGVPLIFARVNPENGNVDTIGAISKPPGYPFATFDVCKNQYIFENQGVDGNVDLYWLDANNGFVRKHVTAKETYTHIMCVNLD